jgi:hypothetical protein
MDKFENVLKHISEGMSVRDACKLPDTVASSTFYEQIKDDSTKAEQYARASEVRAHLIFDDIIAIADETSGDITIDDDGLEKVNHENIQRSRLRVDARKWALSKMNPKKYSDNSKLDVTTNGESINIISLGAGTDPNAATT